MERDDLARMVESAGGRLYLIGGSVRDSLRGLPPSDEDYCVTGLTAEGFVALFPDSRLVGKAFPVYRLQVGGRSAELSLARTESKAGIGHASFDVAVSPLITIEQDLRRRDLTINALAFDVLAARLVDPFGGVADIREGRIRAVSPAFAEDPLRVYRAARFAAQLGFTIDPATVDLMSRLRAELTALSVERVFAETRRALCSERPSVYFRALLEAGVLDVHFPEIKALCGVEQPLKHHPEGDVFEHAMQVLDAAARLTERAEIRFAALVHDLGKAETPRQLWPAHHGHEARGAALVRRLCARLRLPASWRRCAVFAAERHMQAHVLREMRPVKVVELLEAANRNPIGVDGFAAVATADVRGRNKPDLIDENAEMMVDLWRRMTSEVTGRDIDCACGGKAFGEALRKARTDFVRRARG
ncbi:MAG: HD domain-containing protein [Bacilli bacterium]